MSQIVKFPDMDRIEAEACDWMARLDAGALTPAEADALQRWLRADERHQAMLVEVAALMDQMGVVSTLNKLVPLSEVSMAADPDAEPEKDASRQWIRSFGLGIAASLLLTVTAIGYFEFTRALQYRTAVGEIRDVVLEDNSRVTLNTDSMISVQFNAAERRIFLEQGEATFVVSRNAQRPFLVEVDGYFVRALGTVFNVSHTADTFEVTVTEGVVEVSHKTATKASSASKRHNQATGMLASRLEAGDQITISEDRVTTQSMPPDEVDTLLSWRQRELVFHGESLQDVIAEVGRYSPVQIVVADESLRAIPIGGVFETGDVTDLVDMLEHGFGVRAVAADDGTITLTRRDSSP